MYETRVAKTKKESTMDLAKIGEVKTVSGIGADGEASDYLQKGWVLLAVKIIQEHRNVAGVPFSTMKIVYILGKPREKKPQQNEPVRCEGMNEPPGQ
jgi:hypothetical protein